MSKTKKKTNPVVLRAGMSIGTNAAEFDDEFLFPCFVHHPAVELSKNVQSRGMVIDGRTGAGKTAILRYINHTAEHVVEVDPSEMAMSYVANSDALRFLQAIGADLDLLFQALWKHVLCIEFIRLRFSVKNESASKSVFFRFFERFQKDARKERALKYLREWEGKFWITMDQNIKELTEKIEKAVKAELGAEIEKFKLGGQYDKRISSDKKTEFIHRIRNIISSDQLSELGSVIDMLAEVDDADSGKSFYILIDKLDENWVDGVVRFKLIRGLMESLKSFRKIRILKILIAMRSDVLERVVQETRDLSFQREKLDDYFIHLKWTKPLLKTMIDKRIQNLFKQQFTQNVIHFEDIFAYNVGTVDPLQYILERTLMRPRDVIAFVNQCIEEAEGKYEITGGIIKKAETEFSRIRREALEQEWQSAFPSIKKMLDYIGVHKKAVINYDELRDKSAVDDLSLAIYSDEKIAKDPLFEIAKGYYEGKQDNSVVFINSVIEILYRTGAVGVKLRNGDRYLYSHVDQPLLPIAQITEDIRVRIHPMLWGAYRIH